MRLTGLLAPERVLVPLRGHSLLEAVDQLLAVSAAGSGVRDPAQVAEVRRKARLEDVVSLGPNAFLPHFRTEAVDRVVAALGVAETPLAWPEDPAFRARIVLLILAPPRDAARYLQALAAFSRALADPDVVGALHRATSAAEILAAPGMAEVELEGPLLVRDIMTPGVLSVTPDVPLADAARVLVQHRWEALPVVGAGGEVVGLLSNRELLQHLVPAYMQRVITGEFRAVPRAPGHATRRPLDIPVRDVMTRSVLCVSEDQAVTDVASLMANKQIDRCPVVKDGRLTGLLTRADIVRKLLGS
ncbi:MAG TPA: CBS domain-containing protein [Gemmatimonadales bacterium]|nr:CBS domain-containing protein [Gemmatimonadales bacterium]